MQPNRKISQFILCVDQVAPQYPSSSKFRESKQSTFSKSHAIYPEQIIINVDKINTQNQSGNIRADVDACLNAIQAVYANRRDPNINPHIAQQRTLQSSSITDNAIHRIDSNIVMDYVTTVYKDYNIKNPFGNFKPNTFRTPRSILSRDVNQQQPRQPRAFSLNRPNSNKKQFLNITQQSKLQKNQASFYSCKKQQSFVDQKLNYRDKISSHRSPTVPTIPRQTAQIAQTTIKKSRCSQKILEDFRYCVNCQKSILSLNIDFHEDYECSGFSRLYQMNFLQLTQFVDKKILRMRGQIGEKISQLRQKNSEGNSRTARITNGIIDLINSYIQIEREQQSSEEQRKLKYNLLKESQNNLYMEVIDLASKLQSFQLIAQKLRRQGGADSNNEWRGMSLLRNISTPTSNKTQIQRSPITFLHPHLHRSRRR